MTINIEGATPGITATGEGSTITLTVTTGNGGGGGSFDGDHNDLDGRDADDAHPISAITGLESALAIAGGGNAAVIALDHLFFENQNLSGSIPNLPPVPGLRVGFVGQTTSSEIGWYTTTTGGAIDLSSKQTILVAEKRGWIVHAAATWESESVLGARAPFIDFPETGFATSWIVKTDDGSTFYLKPPRMSWDAFADILGEYFPPAFNDYVAAEDTQIGKNSAVVSCATGASVGNITIRLPLHLGLVSRIIILNAGDPGDFNVIVRNHVDEEETGGYINVTLLPGEMGEFIPDQTGWVFVKLVQNAAQLPYDNTTSSLTAENVQAAIDEIAASGGGGGGQTVVAGDGINVTVDGDNATVAVDPDEINISELDGVDLTTNPPVAGDVGAWNEDGIFVPATLENPTPADIGAATVTQLDDAVAGIESDLAGKQAADADLTTIGGLSPSNDDVLQRKSGAWTNRTLAQLRTDLSALQVIDRHVLGADAATVQFTNLNDYAWLHGRCLVRSTRSAAASTLLGTFDGNTSTVYGQGASAVGTSSTLLVAAALQAASATANEFTLVEFWFDNSNGRIKSVATSYRATSATASLTTGGTSYQSGSPVDTLELFSGHSANLLAGSSFLLMGALA